MIFITVMDSPYISRSVPTLVQASNLVLLYYGGRGLRNIRNIGPWVLLDNFEYSEKVFDSKSTCKKVEKPI